MLFESAHQRCPNLRCDRDTGAGCREEDAALVDPYFGFTVIRRTPGNAAPRVPFLTLAPDDAGSAHEVVVPFNLSAE